MRTVRLEVIKLNILLIGNQLNESNEHTELVKAEIYIMQGIFKRDTSKCSTFIVLFLN